MRSRVVTLAIGIAACAGGAAPDLDPARAFRDADANRDGRISPAEFPDGDLPRFDTNGDGVLDEAEFAKLQWMRGSTTGTGASPGGAAPDRGDRLEED
jgi:hypothetical protein